MPACLNLSDRLAQRKPRPKIEGERHRGKLARVADGQRGRGGRYYCVKAALSGTWDPLLPAM